MDTKPQVGPHTASHIRKQFRWRFSASWQLLQALHSYLCVLQALHSCMKVRTTCPKAGAKQTRCFQQLCINCSHPCSNLDSLKPSLGFPGFLNKQVSSPALIARFLVVSIDVQPTARLKDTTRATSLAGLPAKAGYFRIGCLPVLEQRRTHESSTSRLNLRRTPEMKVTSSFA